MTKYPKIGMKSEDLAFLASTSMQFDQTSSQHTVSGHYQPTSETQFKWHFAGELIVVRLYMLTGPLSFSLSPFIGIIYENSSHLLSVHQKQSMCY